MRRVFYRIVDASVPLIESIAMQISYQIFEFPKEIINI